MSRIGKKPITLPSGTQVTVEKNTVSVKGPKGELQKTFKPVVAITVEGNEVKLVPKGEAKLSQALWGTYASHINNMVTGVNTPYEKKLIIEGVGYRAEMKGNKLGLVVGFSHPVELDIPQGVEVTVEKSEITIKGIDKEVVGQFAANVRAVKKPEPYKGKGIRYADEVILRKEGKKSV